jgi:hypothetical protein
LLRDLAPVSDCMNYLIKTVDPTMHSKMVELREKMVRDSAHVQAICAISPSLHSTLGIIVNRVSGRHRDSKDAQDVWGVMFVLGNFEGGEAVFSMPGGQEVTTRFRSGDVILLKARDVFHEIKNYKGDLRVTLVYYTGHAVWKEYGMTYSE